MLTRRTHGRWAAWLLLGLAPALAQDAQLEREPNDTAEVGSQTLVVGQPFAGTLGDAAARGKDVDVVFLELAEPTRVDVRYVPEGGVRAAGTLRLEPPGLDEISLPLSRGEAAWLGLTLPAGRYPLTLGAVRVQGVAYRLTVSAAPEGPDAELEPNDPPQAATPLVLGEPRRGWASQSYFDKDRYRIEAPARGVYRLEVQLPDLPRVEGQPAPELAQWKATLGAAGQKPSFTYHLDDVAAARATPDAPRVFVFYPVLEAGEHELLLSVARGELGSPYRLSLTRLEAPAPDAELLEAGRQAIDRGLRYLVELEPKADRSAYDLAADACRLLALGEGSGAEVLSAGRKAQVEATLASVAAQQAPVKDLTWRGAPVERFGNGSLYEQSLITLALAECALAGFEQARPLCEVGVRYLLAAQITPERPEAFHPVAEDDKNCGGWRYTADARAGDLSVSGWCLVALFAADVAGVEVEGLGRGVERALRYVKACSSPKGFSYDTRGKPTSCIQQGIGALIEVLFDAPSGALEQALAQLDLHQCAATQSGWGHDSPFYYWYYATRVHFLRGGHAWRTWRTLTLRQLVERQATDGSWAPIRDEVRAGSRYATGLAVVILRLCLGEAPGYLNQELEAF